MEVSARLFEEISHKRKQHLKDKLNPDFEKCQEEKAYLQHIHAEVDAEVPLIEDWHEPMGQSLSSKLQLNVYHNNPADLECYASMASILKPTKKAKTQPTLSTIILGILHSKKNCFIDNYQKRIKILFDTGCEATLIHHSLVGKLAQQMDRLSNWSTKASNFKTTRICK